MNLTVEHFQFVIDCFILNPITFETDGVVEEYTIVVLKFFQPHMVRDQQQKKTVIKEGNQSFLTP